MKRKQALLLYLVGTLGQILLVSLLVWLLRVGGVRVDYGTPIGLFTLILGGLSSAIWGGYVSIRYHHSNVKQLVRDFFQVKQPLSNYLLVLIFLGLFARKVDLSSVHALYLCSLVTMAYPLFLH